MTRTAIVTGAAQGIGRAIAVRLAGDGLDVTVSDLPAAAGALEELATQLSADRRVVAAPADVTDSGAVDALVARHVEIHGGLDVMVANAGIAVTAPLLETTDQDIERTLRINVIGVFNAYRAAARVLVEQGRGGRLIAAASVAAHRAGKWQGAYSASKFAVRGLNQSVAQELAPHGITANVYSPGVVRTPMWDDIDAGMTSRLGTEPGTAMASMLSAIPIGRLEEPEDVAAVVSFLAGEDSAYVTGQSIVVDGGMWFS